MAPDQSRRRHAVAEKASACLAPLTNRMFTHPRASGRDAREQSRARSRYLTDGAVLYRVLLRDVTAAVDILEDCRTLTERLFTHSELDAMQLREVA